MTTKILAADFSNEMVGLNAEGRRVKETFFGSFMLNVTSMMPEGGVDLVKYICVARDLGREVTLKLSIDDQEVDCRPFVDMIERTMTAMVAEEAQALLQTKLQTVSNLVYNLEREMKSQIRALFPNIRED